MWLVVAIRKGRVEDRVALVVLGLSHLRSEIALWGTGRGRGNGSGVYFVYLEAEANQIAPWLVGEGPWAHGPS